MVFPGTVGTAASAQSSGKSWSNAVIRSRVSSQTAGRLREPAGVVSDRTVVPPIVGRHLRPGTTYLERIELSAVTEGPSDGSARKWRSAQRAPNRRVAVQSWPLGIAVRPVQKR